MQPRDEPHGVKISGPARESQPPPDLEHDDSEISARAEVQQAFPALWKHVRPTPSDEFAHQAERDFAAILDYYRVRWAYEPTSFPLVAGADGRPTEMFTPDFYLPDHRLYIEMTTMRQSLVTRKNRKLRRLRELYPDIRIKLLYRRDYEQLLDVFQRPHSGVIGESAGRIIFSAEEIAERVDSLATEIAIAEATEAGDRLLVLVASAGAERFAADLRARLEALGVRADWDQLRLSRARAGERSGHARVRERPATSLAGRRVLLVTDVVSTGISIDFLRRWVNRQGVRDSAICTLLDRPDARITPAVARYCGFIAPGELVVGYGLHLRRLFADLDHIAVLERHNDD